MPNLEAPISITDSSTERSLSPIANDEPIDELPPQQPQQFEQLLPIPRGVARNAVGNGGIGGGGGGGVGGALRLAAIQRNDAAHVNRAEYQWIPSPAVHLLPVTLPPQVSEPTLDELLRRVTGRNDLHNVEAVHLRVISYTISLSRLSLFLPRLQHLNLSGSVLNSLRDLGLGLVHLNYLNVSNCGLSSADGISTVANAVQVLIADGNMIQRVGPLAELTLLRQLSLRSNRISDLGLMTFLGMCPNLAELDLRGNPVCHLSMYHLTMQRSIRSLQMLDGVATSDMNATGYAATVAIVPATQDSNSTDGDFSSLSSEVCSDSGASAAEQLSNSNSWSSAEGGGGGGGMVRPATVPQTNRPCGATMPNVSSSTQPRRPFSDNSRSSHATFPVVGSVVSWARQQRRNAWISASNSHSSQSNSTHSGSEGNNSSSS